jgi:hypothetical protein
MRYLVVLAVLVITLGLALFLSWGAAKKID